MSANPVTALGPREKEILDLLSIGVVASDIATKLHISPNTVATHIMRARVKLAAGSTLHAVANFVRMSRADDEYESWSASGRKPFAFYNETRGVLYFDVDQANAARDLSEVVTPLYK